MEEQDIASRPGPSIFTCAVCLEDYICPKLNTGGVAWPKTCGHIFHYNCLISWMATCRKNGSESSCPKCRHPITKNDIQVLYGPPVPPIANRRRVPLFGTGLTPPKRQFNNLPLDFVSNSKTLEDSCDIQMETDEYDEEQDNGQSMVVA